MRTKLMSSLLVSMLCLTACDSNDLEERLIGAWQLQTIQAKPLPFEFVRLGSDRLEITKGSLIFHSDIKYIVSLTTKATCAEPGHGLCEFGPELETVSDEGSYTRDGAALQFSASDGTQFTGTYDGNTVTVWSEGLTFVFLK